MMSAPLARASSTNFFTLGTESAQRLRRSTVQVCTVKSITRSAVVFGSSVTGLSCGGAGSLALYHSAMMVSPRAETVTEFADKTAAIAATTKKLRRMRSSRFSFREAYVGCKTAQVAGVRGVNRGGSAAIPLRPGWWDRGGWARP